MATLEVIGYEQVQLKGELFELPKVKNGSVEFTICPFCSNSTQYGLVLDNFCSGCGTSFGEVPEQFREKREPTRTNKSWIDKAYKGLSLLDFVKELLVEGKSQTEIAEFLSILTKTEISVGNVSTHIKIMKEKGLLKSDPPMTVLEVLRRETRYNRQIPQGVLAKAAGISQPALSQVENKQLLTAKLLVKIAMAIGWDGNPIELIDDWRGEKLDDKLAPLDQCKALKKALEEHYGV
jgi:hypothetical protein